MYCNLDDLKSAIEEQRLIELTDDDALGEINQGNIDGAINRAQGEIDGYLAERYAVPLDPVPALIMGACVDVAIYNLYSRKMDDAPDLRQKRYDNAIALLTKIKAGKLSLGVTDPPEEENGSVLQVSAPEPLFPASELDKF